MSQIQRLHTSRLAKVVSRKKYKITRIIVRAMVPTGSPKRMLRFKFSFGLKFFKLVKFL